MREILPRNYVVVASLLDGGPCQQYVAYNLISIDLDRPITQDCCQAYLNLLRIMSANIYHMEVHTTTIKLLEEKIKGY